MAPAEVIPVKIEIIFWLSIVFIQNVILKISAGDKLQRNSIKNKHVCTAALFLHSVFDIET